MKTKIIFFSLVALIAFAGVYRIFDTYRGEKTSEVIVSIPPLHMIAKEIMKGTGEPRLLIEGNTSPHDFALKPSQAGLITHAKVIFWIGKDLEHGLHSSIERAETVKVVTFLNHEGMKIHQLEHDHDGHHNHHHGLQDPHLWLDPENAIKVAQIMAETLSQLDPEHKEIYEKNTEAFIESVRKASENLKEKLSSLKGVKFAVFHNAYQYFQKAYGLTAPQSLTLNPEQSLKITRLREMEKKIKQGHIKCLFTEPQFPQKIVDTLTDETSLKVATLDPLGTREISYVELLERLGQNIINCHQE